MSAFDLGYWGASTEPANGVALISRRAGTRLTIELIGEIDAANAAALDEHLRRIITADGARDLVMDLAGVEFCDTAGLRLLLAARLWAARRGMGCRFIRPSPAVDCLSRLIGRDNAPAGEWDDIDALRERAGVRG